MHERIGASLRRLFDEHRLVFWYDADRDMRDAYEAIKLPDVEKVEIANNEFGLKHRMLRLEPDQKFLVFKDGPAPEMKDNWLLDLQLATAVFKADQAAIWVSDLGIPSQYDAAVRDHLEFFRSQKRLDRLKELERQKPSQSANDVRRKMLTVSAGAEGGLDTVIERLLVELAEERDEPLRLLDRCNLTVFLWSEAERVFGYTSDHPDLQDFAITLFQSAYQRALNEDGQLNDEALLAFRRWKNNRHSSSAFERLSQRYQDVLKVPEDLEDRDFRSLGTIDHFEEIDRHIIRSLVSAMAEQSIAGPEVLKIVRERRQSHWYPGYVDIYQAIEYAIEFQQALSTANLGMTSPEEGAQKYVSTWFRLDQLYRKFIYHMQKSGQPSLLANLFDVVEGRYSNNFLLAVNDAWQDQIAPLDTWSLHGFPAQRDFFRDQVAKFRRQDQKVAVVISDALRFEVAEECLREIRKLNRFDAELSPMLSALPSYTKLGMAALLPNKELSIVPDEIGSVLSSGASTQGTPNREKLLARGRDGDRVKALKFKDFMDMRTDQGKELFRDHDTLYVYHNQIDAIGDKLQTEDRLPEAAESAIEDLTKVVRKLTSANFSNILITADHGFIYQHRALEESDFSAAEPTGEEILLRNRRFVLGRNLEPKSGMKKFTSSSLGLSGDVDVLVPNSINRLRVKGAGSRFVHGGASLQEVIIPVLRVGKQREADVGQVDVRIIVSGRSLISSGQTAVVLYQEQPTSEKRQPRSLRAGIYAMDKTLISDEHDLVFDFPSENPRERELPLKFLLSRAADSYNNQDVLLKLRQRVGNTSHYEDYASHRFQLRRGLTTDFDF